MTLETDLQAAVSKTQAASQKLHDIVNGSASSTVTTESGPVKTLAKTMADADAALTANIATLTTMRDEAVASATAAQTAESKAEDWADKPSGQEVEAGKYSARHWAQQAASSALQTKVQDADGDTGIETERAANDNRLRFKTGGADRMLVDTNGRVGIGETVAPEALLHLKGTAGHEPELFIEGDQSQSINPRLTFGEGGPQTGFTFLYDALGNQLQLTSQVNGASQGTHLKVNRDNGAIRLLQDTMFGYDHDAENAHVHVKTDVDDSGQTPHETKALLKLHNSREVAGAKAVLSFYQVSGEAVTIGSERQQGDSIDMVMGIRTSATGYKETMRIKPNGHIGVGTNTPLDRLHLENGALTIMQNWGADSVNSGIIKFGENGNRSFALQYNGAGSHPHNHLKFVASSTALDNAFDTDILVMNGKGEIGLGTTAMNERLTIDGVISVKEQTDKPNSTTDFGKVYAKTDGKLYYLDAAGIEYPLLTGGAVAIGTPETNMPSQSLIIKGSDGRLYARGYERICGAGGVTEGSYIREFIPVWLPTDFGPVDQVWCGWDYVIVSSQTQNKIATFGNPAEGVLGTGNTNWFQGVNVIDLPVRAVECVTNEYNNHTGERGFIVRLENNDCYAYGWNGEQCLDDTGTQTNNAILTGYKLGQKYLHIGGSTSVNGMVFGVDASDYKTYVWGYNLRGAAGISHGGSIPYNNLIGARRPVSVVPGSASEYVVKAIASYQNSGTSHFCLAGLLTNTGKLYTCGQNNDSNYFAGYPNSSNNNGQEQSVPKLLATDVVDFSIKLWVGGWLKKSNGLIQTWGRNFSGWRGNGLNNSVGGGLENWHGSFFVGKNTKVGWAQSYIYDDGGSMALFALDLDTGILYSAGAHNNHANGQCDNINQFTPSVLPINTGGIKVIDFNFKGCGDGRHESSAPLLIMENGQVWTTGYNHYHMVYSPASTGDNIMHWVANNLNA
jgi:hypothetical protein